MADYMENITVIVIDKQSKNYGCSRFYLADNHYSEPNYPWDWSMADNTEVHIQHISISDKPTVLSMPFGNLKQYWNDVNKATHKPSRRLSNTVMVPSESYTQSDLLEVVFNAIKDRLDETGLKFQLIQIGKKCYDVPENMDIYEYEIETK